MQRGHREEIPKPKEIHITLKEFDNIILSS